MLLIDVPADLPNLTVDQIPWKTLKNVVLPDKPLEAQNNSSTDWAGNTLVRNLNFLDALMIKLNIESAKGAIGILLSANGAGNPWWKGQKRIEFYYGDGNLHILLRDGTQEQEIYDNYVPLKTISGITTGELILRFDKAANNLQIFQDDKSVFLLALVDVGILLMDYSLMEK